jgi:hypothetical protein
MLKKHKISNGGLKLGGDLQNYVTTPSHANQDSFFSPRDTKYSFNVPNSARQVKLPVKAYKTSLKQELMKSTHAASVYYGEGVKNKQKLSPLAKKN